MELQEEVEVRAEAIRSLLPVLYSGLQEGPEGRQTASFFLARLRGAVCELVLLFERNLLRGNSRTGEFLNNMDAVLEANPDRLLPSVLVDTATSLVRHSLTVASAAAGGGRSADEQDISMICRAVVEMLQGGGLDAVGRREEVQQLLQLLEEKVNSALLLQVADHLSCVDQPLDILIHRCQTMYIVVEPGAISRNIWKCHRFR